jgi:hypothetical protein
LGCGLGSGFFTGSGDLTGALFGASLAFFLAGLSTLLLSPILRSPFIDILFTILHGRCLDYISEKDRVNIIWAHATLSAKEIEEVSFAPAYSAAND